MSERILFQGEPLIWVRTSQRSGVVLKPSEKGIKLLTPKTWSERNVRQFLEIESEWVRQAVMRFQPMMLPLLKSLYQMQRGRTLEVLGEAYRLEVVYLEEDAKTKTGMPRVVFDERVKGRCFLQVSSRQAQKSLMPFGDWLEKQWALAWIRYFEPIVAQRVRFYADKMGLVPAEIQVKSYKSRWGSCDAKNRLQFNWRLVLAPLWVVDYVVVHELAHLQYRHHQASFWELVKNHCFQVEEARGYLKVYGEQMMVR